MRLATMSPAMRVAAKVTRAMVTGLAVRRRRHQGPVRGTHARIREVVLREAAAVPGVPDLGALATSGVPDPGVPADPGVTGVPDPGVPADPGATEVLASPDVLTDPEAPGVPADPAPCPFPGPVGDAPSRADAERAVGPDGDCDRPDPDRRPEGAARRGRGGRRGEGKDITAMLPHSRPAPGQPSVSPQLHADARGRGRTAPLCPEGPPGGRHGSRP